MEDSSEEELAVPTRRSKWITSRTTKYDDYQSDSHESLENEDEGQVGEDDEYEIEEYDDCEAEEHNQEEHKKFTNIIASKTLSLAEWHGITRTMNTSAISDGSRWEHNTPETNQTKRQERFLVKWTDLSYLHCSWETKNDLLKCPAAKQKLSMFHKKSVDGLLYSADERGDGVSLRLSLY